MTICNLIHNPHVGFKVAVRCRIYQVSVLQSKARISFDVVEISILQTNIMINDKKYCYVSYQLFFNVMGIQFYEAFKIEMYSLMSLCLKHLVSHRFHYAYDFRVDDENLTLRNPGFVQISYVCQTY